MAAGALTTLNDGAISLAAANWSDTTGAVYEATLAIARGSQAITDDLDFTSMSTGGVSLLDIRRQFTGSIGTSASHLKIAATVNSAQIYYNAAAGTLYLASANTAASNVTTKFEMSGGAGGTAYLTGGTFTNVTICDGTCYIAAGCVVTNLYITGGSVIQEYNATVNTLVDQSGGSLTTKRGIATGKLLSGSMIADLYGGSIGSTSFEQNGGMLDHRAGAIPVYTARAGSYTNQNMRLASTLAGTSMVVYPKFFGALSRSPGDLATWTTGNITYRGSNSGPSYMYGMPPLA